MSDAKVFLAEHCSLCGARRHGSPIDVGDGEPDEDGIVKWAHWVCLQEHDETFRDSFLR